MKSINLIEKVIFSKGLLIPLLSVALLFLVVNTSCNKDKKLDMKDKPFLTTRDAKTTLMNIVPNDGNDDTDDIQAAIDWAASHGGGTVSLPDGDYNVNVDTSIYLRSNVTLAMTGNARLIAYPTSNERYAVIKAVGIHDARVLGGRIIGERDSHLDPDSAGEHGYGITISGSDHIRVVNTRISKCWGDGLIIAAAGGTTSTNITVKGVWSRNNRRQAISVIEVDGLVIDSCQLYNTDGTKPMDGIDIEPDLHTTPRTAQNITITHCNIYSNQGNGIEINARGDNIIRYVTIQNNQIHGNKYSGYCQNGDHITFTDNYLYGNTYDGNHPHNTNCTNSVFDPNIYHAP